MKHKRRLLIYKIIIIVFIITAFVWPKFLTQEAEIDNRALAIAIGIDINNDDDRGSVLASAQILVPVPQGQQVGKQAVFHGTGRTLAEALSYINVKIGRVLDFGQVGLIVFGEEKAKIGVLDDLKYLINNKVRAETTLFVAHNSEARETLKKANSLTEEATSSLNNLLKFNAQGTYMPNINMLQFLSDSNITDKSSFMPILNIQSKESTTLSDGSEAKTTANNLNFDNFTFADNDVKDVAAMLKNDFDSLPPAFDSLPIIDDELKSVVAIPDLYFDSSPYAFDCLPIVCDGLKSVAAAAEEGGEESKENEANEIKDVDRVYLFKNGKAVSELMAEETRGLVWNNHDANYGLIVAENVEVSGEIIEFLPLKLRSKNVSTKTSFKNGMPVITYKYSLWFNSEDLHEVNEKNNHAKPFSKSKVNDSIKKSLENVIKNDIEKSANKLSELNIDALKIRKQFYKFHNSKYKKFINENDDFLKQVRIEYDFEIKIY